MEEVKKQWTMIPVTVETKELLKQIFPKADTYDQGIRKLIERAKENARDGQ